MKRATYGKSGKQYSEFGKYVSNQNDGSIKYLSDVETVTNSVLNKSNGSESKKSGSFTFGLDDDEFLGGSRTINLGGNYSDSSDEYGDSGDFDDFDDFDDSNNEDY